MTRQQLIEKGKIWLVYPDGRTDNILFEGTKSKCKLFIAAHFKSDYKKGAIRLAKLIHEPENYQTQTINL